MSEIEWIIVLTAVIGGGLSIGVMLWGKIRHEDLEAIIKDIAPDMIEPLIIEAYDMAWKAVDQRVKAYGELSNEERLALAKKYAVALLIFLTTGKLSDKANEAMIEYRLYEEHNAVPPREVAIGGA